MERVDQKRATTMIVPASRSSRRKRIATLIALEIETRSTMTSSWIGMSRLGWVCLSNWAAANTIGSASSQPVLATATVAANELASHSSCK